MKKHHILSEGFSPVLYHGTRLRELHNILKTNTFILTPSFGADLLKSSDRFYYMSFARSITSDFISKSVSGDWACVLKLDGRKIGNSHKGLPVSYWSGSGVPKDEMEDRLVSNKPTVSKAAKYITEISILLPTQTAERGYPPVSIRLRKLGYADKQIAQYNNIYGIYQEWGATAKFLVPTLLLCKKYKIPVTFHDSPSTRYFGGNTIDINTVLEILKMQNEPKRVHNLNMPVGRTPTRIKELVTLYYTKPSVQNREALDSDTAMTLQIVSNPTSIRFEEEVNILNNSIANPMVRSDRYVRRILDIMKKERIRTIKQLFTLIANRWTTAW